MIQNVKKKAVLSCSKKLSALLKNLKTRKICLEIYEIDPAKFLSAPRLLRQTVFKKTRSKINNDF